ncbi:hypothetical protein NTE_01891 [Candidatus Nitrososphaera evergladensis SR1]|uniref:Uncharacterized protein n=1 Tax=Candidatus Nitrososphaera evergladensis SR1 TaxID=1459636 RepID=A0A075MS60_9ARCH|nr:hypothetical protein NTE_01891 [Candidatus Nitrososphaera evergladensis SR1]
MLINQTYNSFLIAYSGTNYYTASTLLKSLSRLVGAKIPQPPLRPPKVSILVNQKPWEDYCAAQLDNVMISTDKYLKRHGNVSSVRLWTDEDERREREEQEEEGE